MQPGSLNHTTGTAIAKVAEGKGGLNMLVQPTAGETVIIPLVARGEAEFGLANALEVSVATENNRLAGPAVDRRAPSAAHGVLRAQGLDHAHHRRPQRQEGGLGLLGATRIDIVSRRACSPPSA